MTAYNKSTLHQLSEQLRVDAEFLQECLQESVVEIREMNGRAELDNGTTLHLRKLERICHVFDIDVPTALLLRSLRHRVAELENEIRLLRRAHRIDSREDA